jgi:hypothetical protein
MDWYSYHVYGLMWHLCLKCRCLFIPGRSASSVCFCISLIMLSYLEAILLVVFGFQPDLLLSAVDIAGFCVSAWECADHCVQQVLNYDHLRVGKSEKKNESFLLNTGFEALKHVFYCYQSCIWHVYSCIANISGLT